MTSTEHATNFLFNGWVQLGFAGLCIILMVGMAILVRMQYLFFSQTIAHLRKTELERCEIHAKVLDKISNALLENSTKLAEHTQNSKLFHDAVTEQHNSAEQGINNLAEACDKLSQRAANMLLAITDHSQMMSVLRGKLISAAHMAEDVMKKLEGQSDEKE